MRFETEILNLICEDKTDKQIADKLNLSFRTIQGKITFLLKKYECRSRVGLAVIHLKKIYNL
jgi:DNA-binding NarL/FixJ family response regulator